MVLKNFAKNILKKLGLYYFLQGGYRQLLFFIKKINCRIKYAKYKGSGFTCNVCSAMYSRFVPDLPSAENAAAINNNHVIAGYGQNILCPHCLSTARERLIIALLNDQFKFGNKKILHFSPEKNIFNFLTANNAVTTADIDPLFYKRIDGAIQNEDATQLSFADNSFDVVIANHIMEHIPNDVKALSEIYRVLKPGGNAILQIPYSTTIPHTVERPNSSYPQQQSALYGQKDHVRIYKLDDYVSRLRQCGFTVALVQHEQLTAFYKYAIQPQEVFLAITK